MFCVCVCVYLLLFHVIEENLLVLPLFIIHTAFWFLFHLNYFFLLLIFLRSLICCSSLVTPVDGLFLVLLWLTIWILLLTIWLFVLLMVIIFCCCLLLCFNLLFHFLQWKLFHFFIFISLSLFTFCLNKTKWDLISIYIYFFFDSAHEKMHTQTETTKKQTWLHW